MSQDFFRKLHRWNMLVLAIPSGSRLPSFAPNCHPLEKEISELWKELYSQCPFGVFPYDYLDGGINE